MKLLFLQTIFLLTIILNTQAQRGRVHIQNGTLVTDSGTILRGAHFDTHDESLRDSSWITADDIIGIKNLGLNSIRLFTECPWRGDTAGSRTTFIDSVVTWTRDNSMYLILVWAGWSPNESTPEDSIAHSYYKYFWKFYAQRYKDETHVIFEICNEPSDVGFDSLTIAMELDAYDTIRKYAPETHIQFLSPPAFYYYSEFLNDIENLGDGIDWGNASIAAHAYNWPAQDYIEPIRRIKEAGYAITITEFHSFLNEYANLALTRVFEQEQVSYMHFISAKRMMDDPSVYKSRVESSELRWTPDFGTWPESIIEINYQSPYQYWPAIFYDEGLGWVNYFEDEIITYISNNEYVAYYNIDFQDGPETFEIWCSATASDGKIELRLDSTNGTLVGVCKLASTGSLDNYETFTCDITTPFSGVHDLYLVFKRNENSPMFNIRSWYFIKSDISASQTPFHGAATVLPGKIEAEEYDVGGPTISFLDRDTVNHGSLFRDDDVDIDSTMDGSYCIAWTGECEWLEYTVSCEKYTAMDVQLRVACLESGNKFNIKLNNQKLATVFLDSIASYHDWDIVTIENIEIPAGENQILRIELLGGNFNIDWLNFIEHVPDGVNNEPDILPLRIYPNPVSDYLTIQSPGESNIEIWSMQGQLLLSKELYNTQQIIPVGQLNPGNYIVKLVSKSEVSTEILIIE